MQKAASLKRWEGRPGPAVLARPANWTQSTLPRTSGVRSILPSHQVLSPDRRLRGSCRREQGLGVQAYRLTSSSRELTSSSAQRRGLLSNASARRSAPCHVGRSSEESCTTRRKSPKEPLCRTVEHSQPQSRFVRTHTLLVDCKRSRKPYCSRKCN